MGDPPLSRLYFVLSARKGRPHPALLISKCAEILISEGQKSLPPLVPPIVRKSLLRGEQKSSLLCIPNFDRVFPAVQKLLIRIVEASIRGCFEQKPADRNFVIFAVQAECLSCFFVTVTHEGLFCPQKLMIFFQFPPKAMQNTAAAIRIHFNQRFTDPARG